MDSKFTQASEHQRIQPPHERRGDGQLRASASSASSNSRFAHLGLALVGLALDPP
jgi:hypothetical protein